MASEQTSPMAKRLEVGGDFSSVCCGRCQGALEFHQPDVEMPHRILATCGTCSSWYLIDLARGWLLAYPRFDPLRDA
jgi:hypothetical protein